MVKNKKYPEHSGSKNANWKGGESKCICEVCKVVFYTYLNENHKGRYCSRKCYFQTYKGKGNRFYKGNRKEVKPCRWCGKEYEVYKYRNSKFCSMRCSTMFTLKYCIKQKDTDIELIIENWLKICDIKYEKQKPIGNFTMVDFFIEPDWCLYADGDYWHSKPERIKKDNEIDRKLRVMGYFPQRIKGINIKRNMEFFNYGI